MATSANNINPLPREMQAHTYSIMFQVEESHWWFIGRRRIIEGFVAGIVRKIGKLKPRILDVGCGTGANLQLLSKFGVAESLPFEDASFDLVTGLDVVEHLDDDLAGLTEMRRVLRPGGYALLFVPAFNFLWGVQDDISHHRRRYTLRELKDTVEQAGLTIDRATYANLTFFAPILLGRLLMRATGFHPASENNLTVGALNGLLGRILGAEGSILRHVNLPFGVSAICVARRAN